MTDENFELIDEDYGQCVEVNPSRQIRTRASSFSSIKRAFNSFRVGALKAALNVKVNHTLAKGYYDFNFERKLGRSAKVIARLEEKIMILSNQEVPENYVSRRAIKLRKNMMDNLTFHALTIYGTGYYRIGLGKRADVLAPGLDGDRLERPVPMSTPEVVEPIVEPPVTNTGPVSEIPTPAETIPVAVETTPTPVETTPVAVETTPTPVETTPVEAIPVPMADPTGVDFDESVPFAAVPVSTTDAPAIDLEGAPLDRGSIADIINSSFDAIPTEDIPFSAGTIPEVSVVPFSSEESEEEMVVDEESLRAAVNEAFDQMRDESATAIGEAVVPEPTVELGPVADEAAIPEPTVELGPVADEAAIPEPTVELGPVADDMRVSRNNVTSVHSEQFDENGDRVTRRKKYNYTPMTDEEIRASQIQLGLDENGHYIAGQEPEVPRASVVGEFSLPSITIHDAFTPSTNLVTEQTAVDEQPVRDVPVVVPERVTDAFDLGDETSMFEVIRDVDEKEPVVAAPATPSVPSSMTSADYIALKEKMLELKKKQADSKRQKEEAEKRAQRAAEEVEAAIVSFNQSQEDYNARLSQLSSYIESLEAECDENERDITEVEEEARRREEIAKEKRSEADRTRQIISEIDLMMGEVSTDTPVTSLSVKK